MKFTSPKLFALAIFAFVPLFASAAPGTPIGGIIVKGGKNPGGQMFTLATTDSEGLFTIEFPEEGEYRIEFEGKTKREFRERIQEGIQLNYVVKTKSESPADSQDEKSQNGIIVKEGKNPGDQTLVLTTTDSEGKFAIEYSEEGAYRLGLGEKANKECGDHMQAGLKLKFVVSTKNEAIVDAPLQKSESGRHTPFHNKIEGAYIIINVPMGGGAITAKLQSSKAITQSGVK